MEKKRETKKMQKGGNDWENGNYLLFWIVQTRSFVVVIANFHNICDLFPMLQLIVQKTVHKANKCGDLFYWEALWFYDQSRLVIVIMCGTERWSTGLGFMLYHYETRNSNWKHIEILSWYKSVSHKIVENNLEQIYWSCTSIQWSAF